MFFRNKIRALYSKKKKRMQEHCPLLHLPLHLHLFTVNLFAELISRAACLTDTSLSLFTSTIPLKGDRSPPLKALLISPAEVATL